MVEHFINLALILIGGWLLIVAPSQYIFPLLISKRLKEKNTTLRDQLNDIPFFKFNDRCELIEELLQMNENSDYMKENFSRTYCSYIWSKRIWFVLMVLIIIGTIFTQVVGFFNFVSDPKGQIRKTQEAAEQFRQKE